MVSFFGLKLGGDRKRTQKSQGKQPQQKCDRIDENSLGQGLYFGNNLTRSPLTTVPCHRPVTSCSGTPTPRGPGWRAVFANQGSMSSVTDLPPPVMTNLRYNSSETNLGSKLAVRDVAPSLVLPAVPRGNGARSSARPSTSDAKKSNWVDPLDVHFCRDSPVKRLASSKTVPAPPSSSEKLDVADDKSKVDVSSSGVDGYPSPPQSDGNSERSYSPYHPSVGRVTLDSCPSSNRCNGLSALHSTDSGREISLPNPMPSPPRTRDGKARSAPGLRFPRRPSFMMEFDDPRQKAARKMPQVEGFVGNFSDFDFGDCVLRPCIDSAKAISSLGTTKGSNQPSLGLQDASLEHSAESPRAWLTAPRTAPKPILKLDSGLCGEKAQQAALTSEAQVSAVGAHCGGFTSRVDSKSHSVRAPPPQPLQPVQPWMAGEGIKSSPRSPYGPPVEGKGSYIRGIDMSSPVRPPGKLPTSPFSRQSPERTSTPPTDLPRGRRVEPPALLFFGPDDEDDDLDEHDLDADDDDDEDGLILPTWPSFDNFQHRQSAVPPPLSTSSRAPAQSSVSSAASASAPRIPSPIFPSLMASIPCSSMDLAKSFEMALEESLNCSILSSDHGPSASPTRGEAKKAPPRPEVSIALSPVKMSAKGGFI